MQLLPSPPDSCLRCAASCGTPTPRLNEHLCPAWHHLPPWARPQPGSAPSKTSGASSSPQLRDTEPTLGRTLRAPSIPAEPAGSPRRAGTRCPCPQAGCPQAPAQGTKSRAVTSLPWLPSWSVGSHLESQGFKPARPSCDVTSWRIYWGNKKTPQV